MKNNNHFLTPHSNDSTAQTCCMKDECIFSKVTTLIDFMLVLMFCCGLFGIYPFGSSAEDIVHDCEL